MPRPHPVELPRELPAEQVLEHRNLSCPRYEKCLARACKSNWASWTCQRCGLYLAENPEPGPSAQRLQARKARGAQQDKARYAANPRIHNARVKTWLELNRARKNAWRREHYRENPERYLAERTKYSERKRAADLARYHRKRDELLAQTKAWRQANREKVRGYRKKWRLANPDRVIEQRRRHLAKKRAQRLSPPGSPES